MKKVLHRSFKPAKCKTALQMASSRLKILKNKKDIQIKQLRRELAQLLESGETQTARIRVEHAVREEKTVAAYELVGIYCELLVARLAVIESQKNCPNDLKEAVSSVLYASQRLADVPELSDVVKHFSAKYGKDFASAAVELRPDSGVSRLLVEKLSVKAPDGPTKVKILMDIAKEHNVEWEAKSFMEPDPMDTKVLSGPSSFESASRTHAESPRVPDHEPPYFQAPPAINVQHGSSERNHVRVESYTHDGRSSSHAHSFTSDVNLEKTFDSYNPNARPSGDRIHAGDYIHTNPGNRNSSPRGRQKWEMEFADATAAARAAAESAERASIAARAAAELSSKERMMRQNSTDSHRSPSFYNDRNELPHRGSNSNMQSEGHPSPRRNVMQYEEMGRTKQDNFSGAKASEYSCDELSETAQGRGQHPREDSEMRHTNSFAKSGRKEQPSKPDLDGGYSDDDQLRKQSIRAFSHSRTFSDDHIIASDYIKSPSLEENIFSTDDHTIATDDIKSPSLEGNIFSTNDHIIALDDIKSSRLEENIFATDGKHQSQSSPNETYHHDSSHAAAAFDDYDSCFDKPQFDKEFVYIDEPDYGLGSSLLGGKTSAREGTDGWTMARDRDNSQGKLSSSSQVFQEKPTSSVFDDDSTAPAVPLHEPERFAKFDDYGGDSESEVDQPRKTDEISGWKPVEETPKSTSCSPTRFHAPDETGHDFFPSDTDEPVYDSRTREESDSETQNSLKFGALTGGLKNKKTLPPYRISPANNYTSSNPEKEYTKSKDDQSMSSSPSVSCRSNRKEIYSEKARKPDKKPISAASDPSSSDDDSETELPGKTSIRQQDRRTKGHTGVSYLYSRNRDDDLEEEFPRRASIGNQERTIKQTTGTTYHKRPNTKTQAATLNLPSPFSDDDDENAVRDDVPHTNTKPTIGFSRRTKGQGKAPEKSSSPATTVPAETNKESKVQQSPIKSQAKQQFSSASSSPPKVVTSAKAESDNTLSADTPSKERASHVHPKLPDYEDLLAALGSRRPNRR